jgi:hypothetical protein
MGITGRPTPFCLGTRKAAEQPLRHVAHASFTSPPGAKDRIRYSAGATDDRARWREMEATPLRAVLDLRT